MSDREIDLENYPKNVSARPIGASDIRTLGRQYHLVVKEAIEKHRDGRRSPVTFWDGEMNE